MPEEVVIMGGGIFGLTTAVVLANNGYSVTIIEKTTQLMSAASLVNQNRIHYGFHYPRSESTCTEIIQALESFKSFYPDCINGSFDKFYAISSENSKTNSSEFFYQMSTVLGLKMKEKWPHKKFLSREKIESCWLTEEPVFDYSILKKNILKRINSNNSISIIRNCTVKKIEDNLLTLSNDQIKKFKFLVNATYSAIPSVLKDLDLGKLEAKFQLCVLPLLTAKKKFSPLGITIMDGPFCSIMPKGFEANRYILYHVKDSVNQEIIGDFNFDWMPIVGNPEVNISEKCSYYFPFLKDLEIYDSWITTRIVLPEQEMEDSRPTLVIKNSENIFTIFSGKLITCVSAAYSLLEKLKK